MKLTVDRKELASAVAAVSKFLPRLSALPVLSHVLFEAHSNQLMVSATNLDAGRTVELEAEIASDGRVLIGAEIAQIAKKAGGGTLSIEASTDVTISDGVATWTLPAGAIDDFPDFDHDTDEEGEVEDWSHIQAVAGFASTSGERPILTGVKFGDGWAAATNSYRLAWTASSAPEALVPAYAIRNLDAAVSKLKVGNRNAAAILEDGVWWSRLIDGNFPKWQSLLPSDPDVTATVLSEDLTDALGRAALTAAEIQKGKLVTLEVGDGILVRADGFTELVEAKVEGEATVSLNVKYLTEAVAPVERATLKFLDAYKPVLVEGGGWWNGLIMPVRV